jgi:hypothetical protein
LVIKPGHRSGDVIEYNVPCWTFEKLLREASAPNPIHLLQIDAEGFDYEIIRSIDFAAIRPLAVRFEHQILSQADRNACLELLASHGYRFLLEDGDTMAILQPSQERATRAA